MMTKKDFTMIAQMLATYEGRTEIAQPELVADFADLFVTMFPNFREDKFLAAAAPREHERLSQ